MIRITVVGSGYVGLVSGACLADFGNTVICTDNNPEKVEALRKGGVPIYEPGLEALVTKNRAAGRLQFTAYSAGAIRQSSVVFIAVGTPPAEDGSADIRYVEEAAREIGRSIEGYTVVVDKSTVPIGTGARVHSWIDQELAARGLNIPFDVVSNPEFLREGTAVYDFTHPDRVVIGSESPRARDIMKEVYRPLYLTETPYIETNRESAEMIKYASNAFLAVKISFINEIANLCEKVGANVQDVAKAMGRDGRIGGKFLHPGPGYGGSCFPKDTKAIAAIARAHNSPLALVETTIRVNEAQKMKMVQKIEDGIGGPLEGKTLAILGLAFKQDTGDMRESPALTIAEELVRRGALLRVWDPAAMTEAAWRFKPIMESVFFAQDVYDAAAGSQGVVILTPWNQFRNLDLGRIRELLTLPYFFDLRNIYPREEVEAQGLRYFAVGK